MTMEVLSDCAHVITDTSTNNLKQMDSCAQSTAPPNPSSASPICVGCNRPILDKYVMKVQPSFSWHSSCLKCVQCSRLLDETCTCYIRDGKTYCKTDFHRLFHCSKCGAPFTPSEMVMKADLNTYHVDCFSCTACSRLLKSGDHIAMREGALYCREDNEVLERNLLTDSEPDILGHNNNKLHQHEKRSSAILGNDCPMKLKRGKDGKPTRVRTVLSEKQLQTLRSCYGANPRPDALMKEQLVELTGLSARVIRVWFQNKRCKDKKKSIMLKHLQQQEKTLPSGMQGVAMVAHSPLRHDNGLKSIDSYHHQSWKQIPEYPNSQQDEINHNSFPSLMGSLYGSGDESAVYINEDDYMDCMQPDSVSSQFSGASTSPHSSA